jgi:hypothetical protein
MQIHSDRFETVLPKTARFFTPSKTKSQPKEFDWKFLLSTGLLCLIAIYVAFKLPVVGPEPAPFAPNAPVIPIAPTPRPQPTPEVRMAEPVLPPVSEPPRAQLVHLRTIGTYENDRMPDGRILGTLYRGELPSARSLPTRGGLPGDMWYTRADGHTWVLAPVAAGSQTMGWVDP